MSWEDTGRISGGYREDIGRILGGYFCFFEGIPRNSCRIREGYREDTGRILGGYQAHAREGYWEDTGRILGGCFHVCVVCDQVKLVSSGLIIGVVDATNQTIKNVENVNEHCLKKDISG